MSPARSEDQEDQPLALFSVGIDPTTQPDGCASVGVSKVATGMGAFDHGLGCPNMGVKINLIEHSIGKADNLTPLIPWKRDNGPHHRI